MLIGDPGSESKYVFCIIRSAATECSRPLDPRSWTSFREALSSSVVDWRGVVDDWRLDANAILFALCRLCCEDGGGSRSSRIWQHWRGPYVLSKQASASA
mmetsp:Transcript_5067/g.16446  ORF Transcript_5067/g.16446 Transcript_5067/m.16446 type:complete len:100 (-) Transcript_5067:7-306(-)